MVILTYINKSNFIFVYICKAISKKLLCLSFDRETMHGWMMVWWCHAVVMVTAYWELTCWWMCWTKLCSYNIKIQTLSFDSKRGTTGFYSSSRVDKDGVAMVTSANRCFIWACLVLKRFIFWWIRGSFSSSSRVAHLQCR